MAIKTDIINMAIPQPIITKRNQIIEITLKANYKSTTISLEEITYKVNRSCLFYLRIILHY